ncbi:MAG: hypothetical protein K2H74_01730 [Paramuribaculum sp.]|nr:hypothetical protein [Paramuribaculum sp.]
MGKWYPEHIGKADQALIDHFGIVEPIGIELILSPAIVGVADSELLINKRAQLVVAERGDQRSAASAYPQAFPQTAGRSI